MKIFKKASAMIICLSIFLGFSIFFETNAQEIEIKSILFSGEESADAWSTVLTISNPDINLLNSKNMVRITFEGNAAPSLVLSSWTGGAAWVQVQPCENIDGDLYYSYEDMTTAFGDDMSLVNSISVMSTGAAITVYEIAVVSADSVKNSTESSEGGVKRVVGYLPDWSYTYYKNMDFSAITHINIAFCNPDTDGNLSCMIPDSELHALVKKAHENNVYVLASMGGAGGSDNYPALIANSQKINEFNKKIMSYCSKYNLDGIDLDIEGEVESVFWDTYEEWCLSLRALCDENNLIMTTATAKWISSYVSSKAFECFDFLNIMAYDNDADPNSHSTYEHAVESLSFFNIQRGISKDRLLLGVPFYGRGYNSDGTLSWTSYVAFKDIISADSTYYTKDVYNKIAYNGAETIAKKCMLSSSYGGIMIWEVSQDAPDEYSLLQVIKLQVLEKSPLLGDMDSNGKLNQDDLSLMNNYILGKEKINIKQEDIGDINRDEIINIYDSCFFKRILIYK